ncbi:MAG: hypothetical protein EXR27_10200 [Betaproteobacteria bacterium]|nr:hypothetical protein [Betaproteobacteria bacterium]
MASADIPSQETAKKIPAAGGDPWPREIQRRTTHSIDFPVFTAEPPEPPPIFLDTNLGLNRV